MSDLEGPPPTEPWKPDLVGTLLAGRYRIIKLLGQGGMGSVYLAEHVTLEQKRAIKVLHPSGLGQEGTSRFVRGSRNAARIDHPNVCRVFDYGDPPGGIHFLAMEFIEGESLSEILAREGRLSLARTVSIIGQTAEALQAAHELGIIHRDLKPANIMVTQSSSGDELVKVVDFDISKGAPGSESSDLTNMGWSIGTPDYMSPEQFAGKHVDARSDIFSLGIVLFRALTGSSPWIADSAGGLMAQRLSRPPRSLGEAFPNHDLPKGVQAVINRALAKEPEARWSSAREFRLALEEAAGISARSTSTGDLATRVAVRSGDAIGVPSEVSPEVSEVARRAGAVGRRPVWIGLIAVLTIGAGWGLVQVFNGSGPGPAVAQGDAPDGSTSAAPDGSTSAPALPEQAGNAPSAGGSDPGGAGRSDSGSAAASVDEPGARAPDDAAQNPNDITEAPDAEETAAQGDPALPSDALTSAEAEELLSQIEGEFRRGVLSGGVSDALAQRADSVAGLVWEEEGLADALRAQAADVKARSRGYLEDWASAVEWEGRATELAPDNREFLDRLDQLRGNLATGSPNP